MYELAFHPDVAKDLKSLDESTTQRILSKIEWLVEHVEEMRDKQLTAQWEGMYRLRVGDYPGNIRDRSDAKTDHHLRRGASARDLQTRIDVPRRSVPYPTAAMASDLHVEQAGFAKL